MFYCGRSYITKTCDVRSPHLYCSLTLPHKLPPKRDPLVVNSLPMLGYMEQTVALAITKALTAVGMAKPKYPFITTTKSALIYVAFHLKGQLIANNLVHQGPVASTSFNANKSLNLYFSNDLNSS